jgi:hypothetical protein
MGQLDNPLRGRWGEEPHLLNKITGCESRTVPPLYAPMPSSLAKASHWEFPGKADEGVVPQPQRRESEDLRNGFSHPCESWGCACRRKTAAASFVDAAAYLFGRHRKLMFGGQRIFRSNCALQNL